MAEKIIRWRSLNGNEYSSQEIALRHDKMYEQTTYVAQLLECNRAEAYIVVTRWDKLKKIMEEDQ